ncbi:DnaJ domain-containing protein [Candidatus Woesearchaeota archaeon]|nr:DnaJ domain-containing protein [Candidatus Woesearchaeota archaeon]
MNKILREDELYRRARLILGVEKNATSKEAQKAYHKKAKQYHTDDPDNPTADEELFRIVTEAYYLIKGKIKINGRDLMGLDQDDLVAKIIGMDKITPMHETETWEERHYNQFYSDGIPSA